MERTKTQIKARKSFDYQCNKASKCRHERFKESCFICPFEKTCEIQKAIETARSKMY
jgi:hypothetical protein